MLAHFSDAFEVLSKGSPISARDLSGGDHTNEIYPKLQRKRMARLIRRSIGNPRMKDDAIITSIRTWSYRRIITGIRYRARDVDVVKWFIRSPILLMGVRFTSRFR